MGAVLLPSFLTVFYLVATLGLGFAVTTRILRLRAAAEVFGLSVALGLLFAMIGINALAYLIPLPLVWWCAPFFSIVIAAALLVRLKSVQIDPMPRMTFWVLFGVSLVTGFANARFLSSDPWAWSTLPLIATIRDGNFPVLQPIYPDVSVTYHYGPQLLAAAMSGMTGLSAAAAYNLQPFLGVLAGLFVLSGLTARITSSQRGTIIAPILFLASGGFVWLNGMHLLQDLFQAFVLHRHVDVPFKWLVPMTGTSINPTLFNVFGSRTYTFGVPFLATALFGFWSVFHGAKDALRSFACMTVLACLGLALCTETAFVLLLPVAVFYALFLFCMHGDSPEWRHRSMLVFFVLLLSVFFARIQGGVLSVAGQNDDVKTSVFAFGFDAKLRLLADGTTIPLLGWQFLRDTGLPLFLFPVVAIFAWRRRREMPFLLFIAALAGLHLLVPLVVRYLPRAHELLRIGYIGYALSAFLIALLLSETWFSSNGVRRIFASVIVFSMMLPSMVYTVVRVFIPTMRFESAPLFASMPPITPEQASLYAWIRSNTTQRDLFYLRTIVGDPWKMPDEISSQRDRILFMTYTSRFSVGNINRMGFAPYGKEKFEEQAEIECLDSAFASLGIRYLVVESAERAAWFTATCRKSDWSIRYDGAKDGLSYPRVYERIAFHERTVPDPLQLTPL